jgi:hypothetical protein
MKSFYREYTKAAREPVHHPHDSHRADFMACTDDRRVSRFVHAGTAVDKVISGAINRWRDNFRVGEDSRGRPRVHLIGRAPVLIMEQQTNLRRGDQRLICDR